MEDLRPDLFVQELACSRCRTRTFQTSLAETPTARAAVPISLTEITLRLARRSEEVEEAWAGSYLAGVVCVMGRSVHFKSPFAPHGGASCWSVDADVPFLFDAVLLSQQPWPRLAHDAGISRFMQLLDKNDAPIESISLKLDFIGTRLVAYRVMVHIRLMVQVASSSLYAPLPPPPFR